MPCFFFTLPDTDIERGRLKMVLCRIVWVFILLTETNANFRWVLYTFYQ